MTNELEKVREELTSIFDQLIREARSGYGWTSDGLLMTNRLSETKGAVLANITRLSSKGE